MIGPGKYDDEATAARESAEAEGVILVILNGKYGHGFSAQLPEGSVNQVSSVLRQIADQIETDRLLGSN